MKESITVVIGFALSFPSVTPGLSPVVEEVFSQSHRALAR